MSLLGLAGVQASALPRVESGVTRRAFLKALGVSAVALANLPAGFALDEPLDLDEHVGVFGLSEIDSILKEIYAPAIIEELNQPSMIMQFMRDEAPTAPPWLIVEVLIEGLRPIAEREARQVARDTLGEWKREHLSIGTPVEVRIPEPPPPAPHRRATGPKQARRKK